MIERFRKLKKVVRNLTKMAIEDINGLTKPQHLWNLNVSEWEA